MAIMTPRLFTRARAGHMWELWCLRLSEMEHETKHQRSVVMVTDAAYDLGRLCTEKFHRT